MEIDIPKAFGPLYPQLGNTVAKFRRKGPIAKMDRETRREYGAAVCKAILGLQRSALQRELPSHACPCASHTWHSDGEKILAAVRGQIQAAHRALADRERRERSPDKWRRMYAEAMQEKHNRLALAA
jgi:hypothetical protein